MGLLETQPLRMLEERRLLDALAASESWFVPAGWETLNDGNLALKFRISVGIDLDGLLLYPALFPHVPAYVQPQKKDERWSGHQYGGSGVFCLEYGPDNWHESVTGEDLVRSTRRLLVSEFVSYVTEDSSWPPSRHQLNRGQALRFEALRFVVTPGLLRLTEQMTVGTKVPIQASVRWVASSMVTVVTQVGEGENKSSTDVPMELAQEYWHRDGWAICDPRLADMPAVETYEALQAYLQGIDCWPCELDVGNKRFALVLLVPGAEPQMYTVQGGIESEIQKYAPVIFDDQVQRLPDYVTDLSKKCVAIVGLGSVGSKVAVSLARAGVRNFIILDDDVLGPENLVRHQLTWRSVGLHKADALGVELRLIAPNMKVWPKAFRLAGQENPKSAADVAELLGLCSMVVDATATSSVFITLAAICKEKNIAMVWGELFAGGGGGLMARSRPGKDAAPLAVRNHINACLQSLPAAPDKRATDYDGTGEREVVIAGDGDVSALAAAMTQFALDALGDAEQSQYPVAAYLMGYKKYWVFEQPFHTVPIDCSGAIDAATAPRQLTADEQAALAEFVASVGTSTKCSE